MFNEVFHLPSYRRATDDVVNDDVQTTLNSFSQSNLSHSSILLFFHSFLLSSLETSPQIVNFDQCYSSFQICVSYPDFYAITEHCFSYSFLLYIEIFHFNINFIVYQNLLISKRPAIDTYYCNQNFTCVSILSKIKLHYNNKKSQNSSSCNTKNH